MCSSLAWGKLIMEQEAVVLNQHKQLNSESFLQWRRLVSTIRSLDAYQRV